MRKLTCGIHLDVSWSWIGVFNSSKFAKWLSRMAIPVCSLVIEEVPLLPPVGATLGAEVGGGWFVKRIAVCVSRELDFHLLSYSSGYVLVASSITQLHKPIWSGINCK